MSGQGKVNVGVNAGANNRVINRGTSPIPINKFNKLAKNLNNGEFAVINHLQPNVQQQQPQHHFLRNGLVIGGLGAGIGAMYRYRQPLMKLGQKAYNYASDKFHNLFAKPSNETAALPNPHNW